MPKYDEDNIPEYKMPGRPPKSPKNVVRTSVRCLVTRGVQRALESVGAVHGTNLSDTLRLALYNQLSKDGLLTDELRKDATWDELRKAGLM